MRDAWPRIREAGAELVVVGNGKPYHAAGFREDEGLEFTLLVDPSLTAYKALDLKRGAMAVFQPRAALHALRAVRGGFGQSRTQGDPLQLGGVYVIARGGEVVFAYASKVAGDHPDPELVLNALAEIAS